MMLKLEMSIKIYIKIEKSRFYPTLRMIFKIQIILDVSPL